MPSITLNQAPTPPKVSPPKISAPTSYKSTNVDQMSGSQRDTEIAKRREYEQMMKDRAIGYAPYIMVNGQRDYRGKTPDTITIASPNMQSFVGRQLDPEVGRTLTSTAFRDKIQSGQIKLQELEKARSMTVLEQQKRFGADSVPYVQNYQKEQEMENKRALEATLPKSQTQLYESDRRRLDQLKAEKAKAYQMFTDEAERKGYAIREQNLRVELNKRYGGQFDFDKEMGGNASVENRFGGVSDYGSGITPSEIKAKQMTQPVINTDKAVGYDISTGQQMVGGYDVFGNRINTAGGAGVGITTPPSDNVIKSQEATNQALGNFIGLKEGETLANVGKILDLPNVYKNIKVGGEPIITPEGEYIENPTIEQRGQEAQRYYYEEAKSTTNPLLKGIYYTSGFGSRLATAYGGDIATLGVFALGRKVTKKVAGEVVETTAERKLTGETIETGAEKKALEATLPPPFTTKEIFEQGIKDVRATIKTPFTTKEIFEQGIKDVVPTSIKTTTEVGGKVLQTIVPEGTVISETEQIAKYILPESKYKIATPFLERYPTVSKVVEGTREFIRNPTLPTVKQTIEGAKKVYTPAKSSRLVGYATAYPRALAFGKASETLGAGAVRASFTDEEKEYAKKLNKEEINTALQRSFNTQQLRAQLQQDVATYKELKKDTEAQIRANYQGQGYSGEELDSLVKDYMDTKFQDQIKTDLTKAYSETGLPQEDVNYLVNNVIAEKEVQGKIFKVGEKTIDLRTIGMNLSLMFGDKEAFQEEIRRIKTEQGYSPEEVEKFVNVATKERVARGTGEISGLLGSSAGIEYTGQGIFGTIFKQWGKKGLTMGGLKTGIITGATIAPLGFAEGFTQSQLSQKIRGAENVDWKQARKEGFIGAATAGVLGGTIIGASAAERRGWETGSKIVAYTSDLSEKPADWVSEFLVKAQEKVGRKFTKPVFKETGKAVRFGAEETAPDAMFRILRRPKTTAIAPTMSWTSTFEPSIGTKIENRPKIKTRIRTPTTTEQINKLVGIKSTTPATTRTTTPTTTNTGTPIATRIGSFTTTNTPTSTTTTTTNINTNTDTATSVPIVTPTGFPFPPFPFLPGDSRGWGGGAGGYGSRTITNPILDLATPYFQRKKTEIPMLSPKIKSDMGGMARLKQSTGGANRMSTMPTYNNNQNKISRMLGR